MRGIRFRASIATGLSFQVEVGPNMVSLPVKLDHFQSKVTETTMSKVGIYSKFDALACYFLAHIATGMPSQVEACPNTLSSPSRFQPFRSKLTEISISKVGISWKFDVLYSPSPDCYEFALPGGN